MPRAKGEGGLGRMKSDRKFEGSALPQNAHRRCMRKSDPQLIAYSMPAVMWATPVVDMSLPEVSWFTTRAKNISVVLGFICYFAQTVTSLLFCQQAAYDCTWNDTLDRRLDLGEPSFLVRVYVRTVAVTENSPCFSTTCFVAHRSTSCPK